MLSVELHPMDGEFLFNLHKDKIDGAALYVAGIILSEFQVG